MDAQDGGGNLCSPQYVQYRYSGFRRVAEVIANAAELIQGSTGVTTDMLTALETTLDGMGIGPLLELFMQSQLILVCVAIYAVLVQSIAVSGDPIGATWGTVGYSVLLCFMLFKTGGIAKSIFGAH